MKVLVIGSGLIGTTTAYLLNQRGMDVTVIDRDKGPGLETSFANGALLTPSMAEPWNSPGSWRVLLKSLGRSDSPLQLRLRALPSLAGWGARFLWNSRAESYERNALSNLRLSLYSLSVMESIRQSASIKYGRVTRGTLKIFRDHAALDKAAAVAAAQSSEGLGFRRLSPSETIELEPALAPVADQLAGTIHFPVDETGDAYRFCVQLAEHSRRQGVDFRFGNEVSSLEVRAGQVTAAVIGGERVVADRYIVAAGCYSAPLLRSIGVRLPVRPAKGYSVTFDAPPGTPLLGIPLVDDDQHAAIVPLEGAVRVVGTAEFAGYDKTLNGNRIQNLTKLLRGVLPHLQIDPLTAKPWCGLRPMSADGVPVIGRTHIPNLMVNTGHGHLGWTMAAGSARLLADLMAGDSPAIDPTPFAFSRFN
jgi:D-amino-acid dehydrogenase